MSHPLMTFAVAYGGTATILVPPAFTDEVLRILKEGTPNPKYDPDGPTTEDNSYRRMLPPPEAWVRFAAEAGDDTEELIRRVVSHGLRHNLKHDLTQRIAAGGLGGTVAPVSVDVGVSCRVQNVKRRKIDAQKLAAAEVASITGETAYSKHCAGPGCTATDDDTGPPHSAACRAHHDACYADPSDGGNCD